MTKRDSEPSLVNGVVASIRRRIMTGEYPPGHRLRIPDLAKACDVSTIPVREALRVLEGERMVEAEPNRGAVVADLSVSDLNDLYAVRMRLEPLAVASQGRLRPDEVNALTTLLDELEDARARSDTDAVMDFHRRFHFDIYERSDSTWLPHLTAVLWNHAERYQFLSLTPRYPEASTEHLAIVDALAGGRTDDAGAIMHDHLESTRRLLEVHFSGTDTPVDASITRNAIV